MPVIRYVQRHGLVWQLTMLCAVLLMALGGSVVGIFALLSARSTAVHLRSAQVCVNNTLGARQASIKASLRAQQQFASSLKRFEAVAFDPTRPRADKTRAAAQFRADTTRWEQATHRQLVASRNHPLGKC